MTDTGFSSPVTGELRPSLPEGVHTNLLSSAGDTDLV